MMKNDKPANSETIRRKKNRRLLRKATTQYFKSLSPLESEEEHSLVESLALASSKVNFDEPSPEGAEDNTTK